MKPIYDTKELEVEVMFNETCIYQLSENADQINKLYGVSQGMHHKNSCRYGWRCVDGVRNKKIELLAYCYVDGVRIWEPIRKISVNRWVKIKLEITSEAYVFTSGGKEVKIARKADALKLGYMLNPYFGGKIPAPHDMKIEIK